MQGRRLPEVEKHVARDAERGAFSRRELDDLPPAVRQYFETAIAPGAPLARSARVKMRGSIKIGRWVPFRAREVLSPHNGLVWRARAAGVITGFDRYVDGVGVMNWKLAGLATVMHAEGADVSCSTAGRAGGEAMWLPTALLPRFGVAWSAQGAHDATARFQVDDTPLALHLRFDDASRLASLVLDRWGDPHESGTWGWHPFGGEVTGYRSFGAVTIPSEGRFGWFFGTDRWADGDFRYRITDLHLITESAGS